MTTRGRPGRRDPARDLRISGSTHVEAPAKQLGAPPWARVRRVQLIRREIREGLTPGAVEVLFDNAELVVEGGEEVGGEEVGGRRASDRRVFATVMVTIDLTRCAGQVQEPADEVTARRVAELMAAEPRVEQRLRDLAARELARLCGAEPEELVVSVESILRVEGTTVLVDVDAMATLAGRRE